MKKSTSTRASLRPLERTPLAAVTGAGRGRLGLVELSGDPPVESAATTGPASAA